MLVHYLSIDINSEDFGWALFAVGLVSNSNCLEIDVDQNYELLELGSTRVHLIVVLILHCEVWIYPSRQVHRLSEGQPPVFVEGLHHYGVTALPNHNKLIVNGFGKMED